MKKLSATQEAMLRRLAADLDPTDGLKGRAEHGAASGTLQSLRRLGFVWGYKVTKEGLAWIAAADEWIAAAAAKGRLR